MITKNAMQLKAIDKLQHDYWKQWKERNLYARDVSFEMAIESVKRLCDAVILHN